MNERINRKCSPFLSESYINAHIHVLTIARQFKEAARLSAEIKQLGADIEEYKGSLSEKEKQLCAKKREHESSEQGIASIKAELDVLQREEGV